MLNLISFNDMLLRPKPSWLLVDRIPTGSLVVLYGAPKVGKSLIALDWSIQLAKQGVSTLYSAGEGIGGYGARLRAWQQVNGKFDEDLPAYLGEKMMNFSKTGNMIPYVKAVQEQFRHDELAVDAHGEVQGERSVPGTIDFVVVDTLSRALPGVDENDQGAMSDAIERIDEFRNLTGATVLLLHHTTKASPKKWRGSSVIEGAADAMILAYKKDGLVKVEVEVAREFESGKTWTYHIQAVADSAIAKEIVAKAGEQRVELTKRQEEVLNAMEGPTEAPALAEKLGLQRANVVNYLNTLLELGLVKKLDRGLYAPCQQDLDTVTASS